MARLLLVRHGKTKLYKPDRFWGSTDVPLSNYGIRQAAKLRDRLAKEKITSIYTSELRRARLTAETIASRHAKVSINTLGELNELNFGYVEGLTFDEITRLHPELAGELINWSPHPTFPNGENLDDLNLRVQQFLGRLENLKPKETVLIVAHAGPLRLIICHLLGIDTGFWRKIFVDLASLSIMETFARGAILRLLNDVSHLKT